MAPNIFPYTITSTTTRTRSSYLVFMAQSEAMYSNRAIANTDRRETNIGGEVSCQHGQQNGTATQYE